MEIDDLLWESSKTSDKAISFFSTENNDILVDFKSLSEIKNDNMIQNTFITDETGEALKSDIQNKKCTEIDAQLTIRKIISHQDVSFKKFTNISSKLLLLDKSLITYEENCIIKILLFVKDTLPPSDFNRELLKRPFAVQMYSSYLKQMNYIDRLIDLYKLIDKPKEVAILNLKRTMMQETTQLYKIENLKKCSSSHFQSNYMLYFEYSLLQDYIKLLQLQIQIKKDDDDNSKKLIMNRVPLILPLFGRSLIDTLKYSCIYHYSTPETYFTSPLYLKKEFQISVKHFQWQSLKSRCALSYWHEIEKIFLSKNFFGMSQIKSSIGFEKVVTLLFDHKAPREILIKYCDLVEDVERRIELAKLYDCKECLIMAYKQTRNKSAFIHLKSTLRPDDPAFKLALEINNDHTIKWKI